MWSRNQPVSVFVCSVHSAIFSRIFSRKRVRLRMSDGHAIHCVQPGASSTSDAIPTVSIYLPANRWTIRLCRYNISSWSRTTGEISCYLRQGIETKEILKSILLPGKRCKFKKYLSFLDPQAMNKRFWRSKTQRCKDRAPIVECL